MMKYKELDFSALPENPSEREWLKIEQDIFEAYEFYAYRRAWDRERQQVDDEIKMDILLHVILVFRKHYASFLSGKYNKSLLITAMENRGKDIWKKSNPYRIFSFGHDETINTYQEDPIENDIILAEKEEQHQDAVLKLNKFIESKPHYFRIYSEYHRYSGDKTFIEMAEGNRLAEDVLKKQHVRFIGLLRKYIIAQNLRFGIVPELYLNENDQTPVGCKLSTLLANAVTFIMKIFKRY